MSLPLSAIGFHGEIIMTEHVVYFSHLRWADVQTYICSNNIHINEQADMHFVEYPVHDAEKNWIEIKKVNNISVYIPHLTAGISKDKENEGVLSLLADVLAETPMNKTAFICFTPETYHVVRHFEPRLTIYDQKFKATAFKYDVDNLKELEKKMISISDVLWQKEKVASFIPKQKAVQLPKQILENNTAIAVL